MVIRKAYLKLNRNNSSKYSSFPAIKISGKGAGKVPIIKLSKIALPWIGVWK